jgi:hypothetical protein
MTVYDWIPATITSALLVFALWLSRSLILTRLTKSVQHEFDNKIEIFKAELRSKEAQLVALREYAMSGLSSRQVELEKRRIEAAEQIWSAVIILSRAKGVSAIIAVTNFQTALIVTEANEKARDMFSKISPNIDLKELTCEDATRSRMYVSQIVWAVFSAYRAVILFAVMKLEMLKIGVGDPNFFDTEPVNNLLKIALPDHIKYIETHGDKSYHNLLDILESRILDEIQKMLHGVDSSSEQSIIKVAELIKATGTVMGSLPDAIT